MSRSHLWINLFDLVLTYIASLVCFICNYVTSDLLMLELLHTHLGFIFPKVFPCLLVIISHYPVSYILGENIPPGEYSLSVDTSV
jgi:hypothetical protein